MIILSRQEQVRVLTTNRDVEVRMFLESAGRWIIEDLVTPGKAKGRLNISLGFCWGGGHHSKMGNAGQWRVD